MSYPTYHLSPPLGDKRADLLASGLESDAAGFWRGRFHELADGVEDDMELAIVLPFQLIEASDKSLVRGDHFSKLNKRSHNGNIYLDCAFAVQHAGDHGDTLFGEYIGQISATTPS